MSNENNSQIAIIASKRVQNQLIREDSIRETIDLLGRLLTLTTWSPPLYPGGESITESIWNEYETLRIRDKIFNLIDKL